MSLVATTLAGVVFGLALAVPPGPMNAVIATESVLRGWSAGFRAGLGAMVADVCFLGLALAGLVTVVQRDPRIRAGLFALGGLLMLYFASQAFENARSFGDGDVDAGKGFRRAFALAITNPFQIAFWLTVGVGLLESGTLDALATLPVVGSTLAGRIVIRTGHPALVAGFFGGIAVWIVGFPAALVGARRRVESVAPLVTQLSAAVLAVSGVLFLVEAAGRL